jgi:ribosome-associated toxin RatA of RatAB toxin-antitoxin module
MPTVTCSIEIAGASMAKVWDALCDFESYPHTMQDVIEVQILKSTATESHSSWRVLLNGSELTWTERDVYDAPYGIVFEQLEGDLETYRGAWVLLPLDDRVKVTLEIEFELGIPSLAALLDPIGIEAIRTNSAAMLAAIGTVSSRESLR